MLGHLPINPQIMSTKQRFAGGHFSIGQEVRQIAGNDVRSQILTIASSDAFRDMDDSINLNFTARVTETGWRVGAQWWKAGKNRWSRPTNVTATSFNAEDARSIVATWHSNL